MSYGETAFEDAREYCAALTASTGITKVYCACVRGCPYLHQILLSKILNVKPNLKTFVTKYKFLNVA